MTARRKHHHEYDDITEAAWQEQIIDTLHLHGWRVAHFRPAGIRDGKFITPVAGDGAGFPDLLCVHPKGGDIMAVELKSEKGNATPAQLLWLTWFEAADIDGFVWRPSDVDAAIARIAAPQHRVRRG